MTFRPKGLHVRVALQQADDPVSSVWAERERHCPNLDSRYNRFFFPNLNKQASKQTVKKVLALRCSIL